VKDTHIARRLRNAIVFSFARGAGTAIGSAAVGLACWWITHH
jgi:hypothetical protein